MSSTHDYYAGRQYTVPNRSDPMGAYNPRGPPFADPSNPNVLRFSTPSSGIPSAEVIDHTNTPVYRFQSSGAQHLEMFDASSGTLLGRYADGLIEYGGQTAVKAKQFVKKNSYASSGILLDHADQRYELIQEIFYAIVRAIPVDERVAIVYNYTGKPAIEFVGAGPQVPGLQPHIVFVAALLESGVMKKKQSAVSKAIKKIVSSKKEGIVA